MGQRIDIRRATVADAQAMADFTAKIVAEKLDTILLDRAYTAAEEAAMLSAYEPPQGLFMLAFDAARVIGMCDLKAGLRPGNRHLGVLGMSVLSGYRSQGIGRRLLEAVIAQARTWPGFCRIELGVTPWNTPGIALYESLGFKLEGVKAKGINLRGRLEDDLLMALVW